MAVRTRVPARRRGITVASALARIRARRTATVPAAQLRSVLIVAGLTRRRRTPVSGRAPFTIGATRTRRGRACRVPSGAVVAGIRIPARGALFTGVAAGAGASPVVPRPATDIRGRLLTPVAFTTGALIQVIAPGARVASAMAVAAAVLVAVGILVIGHVGSVRSRMRACRYLLASLNSRRKPENMPLVLPSCSPTTRAAF